MKKFICGLVVGILISSSSTAFAVTKNIKKASFNNDTSITVDGKQTSIQLVAVTLEGDQNGSNYGPVRGIVEAMGGKIEYDPKAKNIDIQTSVAKEDTTTKEDKSVNDQTTNEKIITKSDKTSDGLNIYTIKNSDYVCLNEVFLIHNMSGIKFDPKTDTMTYKNLIIPHIYYHSASSYIPLEYYVNTLLPIIEQK